MRRVCRFYDYTREKKMVCVSQLLLLQTNLKHSHPMIFEGSKGSAMNAISNHHHIAPRSYLFHTIIRNASISQQRGTTRRLSLSRVSIPLQSLHITCTTYIFTRTKPIVYIVTITVCHSMLNALHR